MKGHLLMSVKERKRKVVFEDFKRGRVTQKEGAEQSGITVRQFRRSYRRYEKEGDEGLLHRSRGRPSNRSKPRELRLKAIELYLEKYEGWGPTLAAEKLEEEDGIKVDHETFRRWLISRGEWKARRRKPKHRERRERMKHFGELLQIDGSHHRWFGEDEDRCCMMQLIDDATGERLCLMGEEETTELAMRNMWLWIEMHGIPKAVYADRKTVFFTDREPTREEQLAGEEPMTAFGKSLAKLGVKMVRAHSPQAKGRVERSHGVYQDRLVKELRLKGIKSIERANELLLDGFTEKINAKFAVKAAKPQDFHSAAPKGLKLSEVFCSEDIRAVAKDWTVRHKNSFYQIVKKNRNMPMPKDKVIVRTKLDSSVQIVYRDKPLKYKLLPEPPGKQNEQDMVSSCKEPKETYRPAADHPWRRRSPFPPSGRRTRKGTEQYAPL